MIAARTALVLALLASCQSPPGHEWEATLGTGVLAVDGYTVEDFVTGLGTFEYDTEVQVAEFAIGGTRVSGSGAERRKHEFAGVKLSNGDSRLGFLGNSLVQSFTQLSGGGLLYFEQPTPTSLVPYLSFWSVITNPDSAILNDSLSLEVGAGVEVPLNDRFAGFLEAAYLFPVHDAQYDGGLGESRFSGWGLRIGVRALLGPVR